jgi:homospermidine synthase
VKRKNLIILGGGSIALGLLGAFSKDYIGKWKSIKLITNEISLGNAPDFVQTHKVMLERATLVDQLDPFVLQGDVVVNVTVSVGTVELIQFCRSRQALYLDTSNEAWPDENKLTTYDRRNAVLESCGSRQADHPSALICHGANPGLVTHFLKHALEVVARNVLGDAAFRDLDRLEGPERWGQICRRVGIDRIDISEHDSQSATGLADPNAGFNTWSVEGLLEESFEPSCFPYCGTTGFPSGSNWMVRSIDSADRPLRIATSRNLAIENSVSTWIPGIGWFSGYQIPHPEQFSMASLCSWRGERGSGHPTVRFVYSPCPAAKDLLEKRRAGPASPMKLKVLMDEIENGSDTLGITVFLNDGRLFWYGSALSVDFARSVSRNNNATTLQVVAGIYAGVEYIIQNPREGLLEPEDLEHQAILNLAKPFLGTMIEAWGYQSAETGILSRTA